MTTPNPDNGRPLIKETVTEILNKTSNTQFTVTELRDAVNDQHILRNINAYASGAGAVAACVQRMWDRDQLPEGWVFDTLHSPKLIRRRLFHDERRMLLDLEYQHRHDTPLHRATPEGEREANLNAMTQVQLEPEVQEALDWAASYTEDRTVIALVRVYSADEDLTFDLTDPETIRLVIDFLRRMEKIDHLKDGE